VIRDQLHGAAPPRYAGYTCWRGICRGEELLLDGSTLLSIGSGTQFGAWPCGAGQLYWFLTQNAPAGRTQTKADAVALCRHWAAPIPEIVEGTAEDAIHQSDIFDRPPLSWWGRGRITLLGDAAHPATPNLGQGACQALEDAIVLADCVRRVQAPEAALREYEQSRIPRTRAIVKNSWQSGRILQMDRTALEKLRNWLMGTSVGTHLGMRMLRELLAYKVPMLKPPT
jgi:2-polyprenyl-6-methoxyphenol hydroxylase-like FAD-dependent oxidoreductase